MTQRSFVVEPISQENNSYGVIPFYYQNRFLSFLAFPSPIYRDSQYSKECFIYVISHVEDWLQDYLAIKFHSNIFH